MSKEQQLGFDCEGFEIPDLDQPPEILFETLKSHLWTEHKAKLIERYLYYFVQITYHGTYIDGFAGPQAPDHPDTWSARLVLESRPRWLGKFFLCDLDVSKYAALQHLVDDQPPRDKTRNEPKRDIQIRRGDFNEEVKELLASGWIPDTQAAFCLLDQQTFECQWQTVEALANYKRTHRKIELFYFLAQGWFGRAAKATTRDKQRIPLWWGRDDWEVMLGISPLTRARMFCDRLKELGYRHVHPWPIFEHESGGGRVMYHMIHATDHDEAPKLMARAYKKILDIREPQEQLELLFEQHGIQRD